jgi:two-component system, response regulator
MSTENTSYSPLTFLIVHDSPEDLYMLVKAFQDARIWNKIYILRRGADVLPFLRKQPPFENKRSPDVILLKHNPPDMPSEKIIDQINDDPKFSDVKIAMLIDDSEEARDQAFSLDTELVLSMPVKPDKLFAALRSIGEHWCTFGKIAQVANSNVPSQDQTGKKPNNSSDATAVGVAALAQ